ncbi:cell division protein FtsB [Frischella sp. Ac48]|uniref:Cell division protein FtsB n=1 Tax=Frischella japonica TaxID=2741544 RepID=A0ABR7QY15_9GAMM|nr:MULTISPECIES: cell division protein FtsB [Frischella]MBC9131094.1 cell division protein FtsB [Frischella japonica]MBX4132066.1 cell division protein FtsB [Frischella sp. Ac48]
MLLKWRLSVLLIIILCYLQHSLWFGKNNLFDYWQNRDIVNQLTQENDQLKMRNEHMFAEVADLYQGSQAVEERARNHLGMIKPDEHFYRIVTESVPSR